MNSSKPVIENLVPGAQYQVVMYLRKGPLIGPPSDPVTFAIGKLLATVNHQSIHPSLLLPDYWLEGCSLQSEFIINGRIMRLCSICLHQTISFSVCMGYNFQGMPPHTQRWNQKPWLLLFLNIERCHVCIQPVDTFPYTLAIAESIFYNNPIQCKYYTKRLLYCLEENNL